MIGREIAIGFGIAILLPLLAFYGVCSFVPQPEFPAYIFGDEQITANSAAIVGNEQFTAGGAAVQQPVDTPEQRKAAQEKFRAREKVYNAARAHFGAVLFYAAVPIGYLALLIGGFLKISGLGTGLMFGGIFSIVTSFLNLGGPVADWQRFVSLAVALAILLLIGLRKVPKRDRQQATS